MNNYSEEHNMFIKKIKKQIITVTIFRISIIVLFIILWQVGANLNIINTFLFSSPLKIIETAYDLFKDGILFENIGVTLFEVGVSFIISGVVGIVIASILWSNKILFRIVDPYITILNSLPKVALGPLIIIWFGASMKSIIFMSLLISIFITIINVYQGLITTNEEYIIMSKSFGANKWQIFKYVIFPSNMSNIISALKINISMNLIGVIMGELLVSKKGLGYLIMYGSQIFNINLVITCIFILGIISYLMYYLINKIK